jgi:hypothetical protein
MFGTQLESKCMGKNAEFLRNQLRIVLVGGHTRNARQLIQRGRTAGWRIERHTGEVRGRGSKELRAQIGRADVVVITTQVNSHGGMFQAKDFARRLGRFVAVIRRDSFTELEEAIAQFQNNSHQE